MNTFQRFVSRLVVAALVIVNLHGCASIAVGTATTAAKLAVKVPLAVGSAVIDAATESEEERLRKELRELQAMQAERQQD